jgi:hypothetical protein
MKKKNEGTKEIGRRITKERKTESTLLSRKLRG